MRADLLHQVDELNDVTNIILLTHNIDFVFLQSVVMSYVRSCGDPVLTILADADCAGASYSAQRELLEGMGTRYRVVPIRMQPGFVFHPKAMLLSGPQHATLYVGSGNLTFGGFRQNGEVWSRYTAADDGRAVFDEFRAYVGQLLERVPLADAIRAELEDAFDPGTKIWTGTAPAGNPSLIGRAGGEEALLNAVIASLGTAPADQLVVCSPYYDVDGDALAALRSRIPHARGLLLHPGRGSTLTASAWENGGIGMARRPCEIRHPHQIEDRPGFVHAKFYAAIRGEETIVVQGSANCTRAALLMNGPRGNAELMTVLRMPTEAFRENWLETLVEVPGAALTTAEIVDSSATPPAALQILAARSEDGVILVAYRPPTAEVSGCSIDGKPVAFTVVEPGHLHLHHIGAAPALRVEGAVAGVSAVSPPHWVDQEHQLRATARRRSLNDAIPRTLGGENWTPDQWIELLQVLSENLKYTPARARPGQQGGRQKPGHKTATRSYEDLFAKDFSAEMMLAHWKERVVDGESHDSIRKLLMRWFGVAPPESSATDDHAAEEGTNRGEGDQEEEIYVRPHRPAPASAAQLTAAARLRLERTLAEIEATMTAPAYLEFRPPDFLRADLMMVSVILRFGYTRDWLRHDVFFAFSHSIWAHLFLSSKQDPGTGWLEWRHKTAPDPAAFMAAIASPQLSAALITWTLIGLDAPPSVNRARFMLARVLSAARLPDLWFGGGVEAVSRELVNVLQAGDEKIALERVSALWRETLECGAALRALEELLEILGLDEALKSINAPRIEAGELLWQGRAGYCITLVPGSRTGDDRIRTQKLQLGGTGEFQGRMTLPVRAILEFEEVARALPPGFADTLRKVIAGVREDFASHQPEET